MEITRSFADSFFYKDWQPELENIGTRREVNGKCALKITDKISSAHEKKIEKFLNKSLYFQTFHTVVAAFKSLEKLGTCSVSDSVFGNSCGEKIFCFTELIPTTILSFLQSVIFTWIHFCSRGSPTIFIYIYTVRFNQIPCRSLRLHLSLQKKTINKQTTNS